jgi:serine/threonine protein kinase/formylglycine-generating enzyme required for sulfatase activity
MADFKTALQAMASGRLELEALSRQLDVLLKNNPKFATRMLAQLEEVNKQDIIPNYAFTHLKRQINEFRRSHAGETESDAASVDTESTVFAMESEISDSSDDPTEISQPSISKVNYDTNNTEPLTEIENEAGNKLDTEASTEVNPRLIKGLEESNAPGTESVLTGKRTIAQQAPSGDETLMDITAQNLHSSVDFDVSMDSTESFEASTSPTGTGWEEPSQQGYVDGHELGVGDVIKQRFKLLEVLGVGGMGKVFKGIDLLKEEAQDKNPYCAIKLLNEDFKSHPEAFISLQRESSRQQKLAHPNIATVYDFDRIGGRGTPVFITMELMEGQPLNSYIKKVVKKQGGLPFEQTFDIVRQLAAALQYAHERRLVHSDFKPGNAFLCNDSTVKTLDFGIARAVKNPVTGEAEKTLFDPGKLGALTPAYASLEMLEGEEPDTRDDTYALGCVTYELLTGKHPFNKLPATTAKENGLAPPIVKGLNKKQNRALRRCVAFRREDRPQKVEDFIEEFEGRPTWHKNPFTIAAAILLIIGIAMINPTLDYLHEKEIETIISEINTGTNSLIVEKLAEIKTFDTSDLATITDGARNAIQRYFSSEITRHIDISSDNFDFPGAERILAEVAEFYPESVFIQQQADDIEFNKKQKISELYQQFIAALDPNLALLNPESIDGTKDVLVIIQTQIDPLHPLLTDTRPSNAYRLAANLAFENGDLDNALAFVNSGLLNSANDPLLNDLQSKVQNAIRVAEINIILVNVEPQFATLDDYLQYQQEITELAGLSNPDDSPVLTNLAAGLQEIASNALQQILDTGNRSDAQDLANDIEPLLSALSLSDQLIQIKLAHLSDQERQVAIQNIANSDKSILEARLNDADIQNPQWEADVVANVRELESLTQEDSSINEDLASFKQLFADLYIEVAMQTLDTNRFDAADNIINRGMRISPDMVSLIDTRETIFNRRQEYESQLRITGLKDQFQVAVEADNITQANRIFETLKTELPDDDIYITTQAPRELAESYRRFAERRAESNEFASALQLAEAAVNLNPRDVGLMTIFEEYRARVNITELINVFRNARVFTEDERVELARKVSEVERGAPGEYSDFLSQSESILTDRINFLAQTDENNAAALADIVASIFPDSSLLADMRNRYQLEPWPERIIAQTHLRAGELTRSSEILNVAMNGEYADHPDVMTYRLAVQQAINDANESFDVFLAAKSAAGNSYGNLTQTKILLYRAQADWVDNPAYREAETEIDQLIANASDNPSKRILQRAEENIASASEADIRRAAEEWTPIPSDRACTTDKASYGTRARAICYDFVNTNWRGPLMVVVPAGGPVSSTFAIGKYEISVEDWSKYCAISGNCEVEANRNRYNDPITGISLSEAQQYVDWLSRRTGKPYRLPSAEEWEYAASVGGTLTVEDDAFRSIKGELNCRVTLGDRILKGTGTTTVRSGKPNQWGIYNFVGNVQEWVRDGSTTSARGGAYSDAINNCDISTVKSHDGSADDITGFRVILEEVG